MAACPSGPLLCAERIIVQLVSRPESCSGRWVSGVGSAVSSEWSMVGFTFKSGVIDTRALVASPQGEFFDVNVLNSSSFRQFI